VIKLEITKDWRLEKVIDFFPETLSVFYNIGFTELESPIMRHAAKLITVKEAAGLMGAEVENVIVRLNECIQGDE
jgi:hypothetical protein